MERQATNMKKAIYVKYFHKSSVMALSFTTSPNRSGTNIYAERFSFHPSSPRPAKLVRDIVIPNTCVKLYRNWIINGVARAKTKGDHTYVRTGQTLYPLHNFVVRGDKKESKQIWVGKRSYIVFLCDMFTLSPS